MKEAKFSKKEIPPHACLWTGFRKNDVFPAAINGLQTRPRMAERRCTVSKRKAAHQIAAFLLLKTRRRI